MQGRARHVLAPVARQCADKLALVGEVVATIVELRAVAVPRHADIGAVAIHAGGSEDVGAIDARGIAFRSLTEQMDTTTPHGELLFSLYGALARYERALTRERVMAGLPLPNAGDAKVAVRR